MTLRTKILLPMLGGLLLVVCGAISIFYITLMQTVNQITPSQLVNLTLRFGASMLVIILPIFVLAGILTERIMRPLLASLTQATTTIEHLATGDLNITALPSAAGEMRRLTDALAQLTGYLREVAEVTQHLMRQDFHVTVTLRSDHDTLNQAMQQLVMMLQTMLAEAERSLTENEQQNWLKDGLNRLNAELSGDASLQELCQRAVSFLARQLGAGRGIIYIYYADQALLHVGGTFALTGPDQRPPTIRLGEGIVGQVARERRPIVLTRITHSEAIIATGVVSAPPLNTYTAPLMYNECLYGVVELASFEEFAPLYQNFLQEATQVIATVLSSALQRERMQMLLHESQQAVQEAEQAARDARESQEEAFRQTDALQQANAQLEEQQQQLLQQSEEFRQINRHLEEQQRTVQHQQTELRQRDEALQQMQAEFQRRVQALEDEHQQRSDRQPPAGNSESKDTDEPILKPAALTPEPPIASTLGNAAPRVLLVEDHQSQREALAEFLSQHVSAEIIGVASQEEARIEIDTGRYAAAILDLGLPDGSGYDLCTYINAHNLPLPVIIYTARDLSEREVHNLERSAVSIIVKTARSAERLVDELTVILSQSPVQRSAPSVSSAPPAPFGDLHGRTIVLADADLKHIFIAASLLEDQGATVLEARTGREVLEHLKAEPDIACILWDVALPDSYLTLREIRKNARFKHLPVLALTAKDSKEQRQQSIQAGANDYLIKPVEPAALLRALNAWMGKM